jgi:hypothetical protein
MGQAMTTQPNPNPQRQLRLEMPANLTAIYSNAAVVSHTHSEIIFDFVQVMPNDPRARIQTRIVFTPANAKLLLQALQTNLDRFEEKHGEISMPPKPVSLADQLFGGMKSEDGEVESNG